MKVIPEHIIISDIIQADGNQEVTLRLRPKRKGGVFRFLIVDGGLKAHPWLSPIHRFEIQGKPHLVRKKASRTAWTDVHFEIQNWRRISGKELKRERKSIEDFWNKQTAEDAKILEAEDES